MQVNITYNTLVNSMLSKLGERKVNIIEVAKCHEAAAIALLEKLKETVRVRANFSETVSSYKSAVRCLGVTIAKARSRDSGAFTPNSVTLISGDKADSGGAIANWRTYVFKDSVYEFEVPLLIFEKFKDEYEDIKIELAPSITCDELLDSLNIDDEKTAIEVL
jgi:hypothetical protein